jgi:hypothetical protein
MGGVIVIQSLGELLLMLSKCDSIVMARNTDEIYVKILQVEGRLTTQELVEIDKVCIQR